MYVCVSMRTINIYLVEVQDASEIPYRAYDGNHSLVWHPMPVISALQGAEAQQRRVQAQALQGPFQTLERAEDVS